MIKLSMIIHLLLSCFVLLFLSTALMAQPSRDRILGDLQISEQDEQTEVLIDFNFPVRYIRHFPATEGDELRIQLKPIEIGSAEREGLFKREAIAADKDNTADLTEVVYEGDSISGLMLTVYFSTERTFSVEQGNDYRSIKLVVKKSVSLPTTE